MPCRSLLRFAPLLAICGALGAGCLSPTLPLPPPEEPNTIAQGACNGDVCEWQIEGDIDPGNTVLITNTVSGSIAGEQDVDDGHYRVPLPGRLCDLVSIAQQNDVGERSAERTFVLQPRANGSVVDPSACK